MKKMHGRVCGERRSAVFFCAVYRMDNFLPRAVISVAIAWGAMQAEKGCKAGGLAFFETEGRKTFKKSIIFAD